jgi:hypothetical protein
MGYQIVLVPNQAVEAFLLPLPDLLNKTLGPHHGNDNQALGGCRLNCSDNHHVNPSPTNDSMASYNYRANRTN